MVGLQQNCLGPVLQIGADRHYSPYIFNHRLLAHVST